MKKIAIVTGGGMGLGQALCKELAHQGATVVVADIDGGSAQKVAEAITQSGGQARAAQVDVSRREDLIRLVDHTAAEFGQLDYMFNNAAIVIGGDSRDLSLEQWDRVLNVNLHGAVYGALAAYLIMVKQGHGHIINVSSLGGLVPQPINTPYSTAKWGLVGFSLGLRFEGADLGVKVSCVCPGDMKTEIYRNMMVVNMQKDEVVRISRRAHFLLPKWTAERAAREILRGVSQNKAMIVFPSVAHWIWRLFRLFPGVIYWATYRGVRMMRKIRSDYLASTSNG